MNRRDYFFRQLVTESELDAGFEQAEQADRAMVADFGLVGVAHGLVVSQHSPSPNLTVDVSAGAAYDQQGQRCAIFSTEVLNLSVDSLSVSTAVAGPGNEKYVATFIKFARALSDPRIDGNNLTVYFVRSESFTLYKVQGAEAVIPAAVPPALISDGILLADARLIYGQTQIQTADLFASRRETAFKFSTIAEGTPEESDEAILGIVTAHVTNATAAHAASAVSYAGSPTWKDGSAVTAINVEAAVDEIVSDLAEVSGGSSGARKVGAEAANAGFVGAPFSLAESGVAQQLAALLGLINGLYRARTITGAQTIDNAGYADSTIFLNPASGAFNLTLVDPSAHKGRRIRLVDVSGVMSDPTKNVTLMHYGSTSINGTVGDLPLAADFGQWWLVSDGSNWYVG